MKRRGFTILELAIVMTLMAILTAIALPVIHRSQLRAKRAEVATNVASIWDVTVFAEEVANKIFEEPAWRPDSAPAKDTRPWIGGLFDDLPWEPDGDVRCSYRVHRPGVGINLMVQGICDLDGDGVIHTCDIKLVGSGNLHDLECNDPEVY